MITKTEIKETLYSYEQKPSNSRTRSWQSLLLTPVGHCQLRIPADRQNACSLPMCPP